MKCLCPFYTLGARFRTWGGFGVFGGGHESVHVHVNFIVSALVSLARCLFPGILAFRFDNVVSWGRAYVLCGRVVCVISLLWVAWCHILCYCLPPTLFPMFPLFCFLLCVFDSRCIRVAIKSMDEHNIKKSF